MRVRFWGVRGSVAYATPESIGYGCNTSCLEVVDETADRRLILDAGSGIVGVSKSLTASHRVPIVLTHYHWDHVQGLPFYAPFYYPGTAPMVWAPPFSGTLQGIAPLFGSPFFSVPYEQLPSQPEISVVSPGDIAINGFQVSSCVLNHPGGAFAYRIHGAQGDLVYATDHEFGDAAIDNPLSEFCAGASALILDSHFTPEELPAHKGWGHSDWRQCTAFAIACGVDRLWLFHHKPGRGDAEMKEIETAARRMFRHTNAAREGESFMV